MNEMKGYIYFVGGLWMFNQNERPEEDKLGRMAFVESVGLIAQTGTLSHIDNATRAARITLASSPVMPSEEVAARTALGMIAACKQDLGLASEQYEFLKSRTSRVTSFFFSSLDRLLGLLAHTMGQLDAAANHYKDGIDFCTGAGYRSELARTCYDYAALRLAQGEREKALELLDESLAISTELGMRPVVERVAALQEKVRSQPVERPLGAPAFPDGLSQREVDVLRLVAEGQSNSQIGGQLFISDRTVSTHLTNIFNKIGASNRAEAASYATRHELV